MTEELFRHLEIGFGNAAGENFILFIWTHEFGYIYSEVWWIQFKVILHRPVYLFPHDHLFRFKIAMELSAQESRLWVRHKKNGYLKSWFVLTHFTAELDLRRCYIYTMCTRCVTTAASYSASSWPCHSITDAFFSFKILWNIHLKVQPVDNFIRILINLQCTKLYIL